MCGATHHVAASTKSGRSRRGGGLEAEARKFGVRMLERSTFALGSMSIGHEADEVDPGFDARRHHVVERFVSELREW